MVISFRLFYFSFALLLGLPASAVTAQAPPAPKELVARVFSMVERNTRFELDYGGGSEPQEKIYLFDADYQQEGQTIDSSYTISWTFSTRADDLRIGLSGYPADLELYIDDERISSTHVGAGAPVRLDYSYSTFERQLPLPARYADGQPHQLEVRALTFDPATTQRQLFLSFLAPNGTSVGGVAQAVPVGEASYPYRWCSGRTDWRAPTFPELPESGEQLDWSDFRYFTGALLAALGDAEHYFDQSAYGEYVDRHHRYFFDHRAEVLEHRATYGHRGGLFNHYARFRMLDDFGPQGVSLAERLSDAAPHTNNTESTQASQLVHAIAQQILTGVPRLADGTLCRITPDSFTVQSDDLFMANLFSLRAGLALGREDLLEDALLQSVNFSSYLTDAETGLYRHAYSTKTEDQSTTIWGRGMGWTMVVDAMLLQRLGDRQDERIEQIRRSFVARCEALLPYQAADGRWHQVITDPTTYLETSATAMFTYALATGYREGWLPEPRFSEAALRGYAGMSSQIAADGTVEGIVSGTPILPSPAAYNGHPTRTNDPRGIGAIIWAALAVDALD
ncbi:hypothetical protein LEM8419_02542 [Neolewinella maritima]|uniref:Glycosyl hydrolase family 88 n=1 Tax=Neolewinella maritima TaxID=1383882 RepID=A0ABN8F9K5_9BACT|nr:glycoside hydrolase family 88 protein [Neolewinella maritima]CAH1001637.1 hypothetical protein LEM8419_02542 [Neolewinella maritima]